MPDRLKSLNFSLEASVAGVVSEAENAVRSLNATAGQALRPLARLLLRTESIASSKVEGMQLGVRELARAEARADVGMKASQTAIEILANIDAMVLAVDEAAEVKKFGVPEIIGIHHRLMERADNNQLAGRIRTQQNWIGGNDYNPCGADFVPPPPEDVIPLLKDLCLAVNDDRLPALVQAALVHAQFETIHPFEDGNGRTGRALIHVVFKRRGLAPNYVPPISVALAASKSRYIASLASFRGNDLSHWIGHFAAATSKAAHLAQAYVMAAAGLTAKWRERLASTPGPPRADAAAWAIIDILPAHPIITPPVAIAVTGRARAAIYNGFEQLEAAGVLLPRSAAQRSRAWEAAGLLDLIAGLESGRMPSGATPLQPRSG